MRTVLLPLQVVNLDLPQMFVELYDDLTVNLRQTASWRLTQTLEAIVSAELMRESYVRRKHVHGWTW